jgi:hypothetical protein
MRQIYKNRQKMFISLPIHVPVSKIAIGLICAGFISSQKAFVISASQNMRKHDPAFAFDGYKKQGLASTEIAQYNVSIWLIPNQLKLIYLKLVCLESINKDTHCTG